MVTTFLRLIHRVFFALLIQHRKAHCVIYRKSRTRVSFLSPGTFPEGKRLLCFFPQEHKHFLIYFKILIKFGIIKGFLARLFYALFSRERFLQRPLINIFFYGDTKMAAEARLVNKFPEIFDKLSFVHGDNPKTKLIIEKFGQKPVNGDNLVLLAELCNYSAKIARDTFKDMRATDRDTAKLHDGASGALMKAAKHDVLRAVIEQGLRPVKTVDSSGQPVVLLQSQNHQIGLHSVGEDTLKTIPAAKTDQRYTGFRRQWLSPLIIASSLGDGLLATVVGKASLDTEYAKDIEAALESTDYKGDSVSAIGKRDLTKLVNEAAPGGVVNEENTLVATLSAAGTQFPFRRITANMPNARLKL
jgi:hypothetical protein